MKTRKIYDSTNYIGVFAPRLVESAGSPGDIAPARMCNYRGIRFATDDYYERNGDKYAQELLKITQESGVSVPYVEISVKTGERVRKVFHTLRTTIRSFFGIHNKKG